MIYETEQHLLITTLQRSGIKHPKVLAAMNKIPRHLFVKPELQSMAYNDNALPIDCEQTISQPYIVARMTEALIADHPMQKVLEIGTGSGYQAAILSQLVPEVYTIERIKTLLDQATQRFAELKLPNIQTLHGDGQFGWPEHSPYDGIIVTAAASVVPMPLLSQLANGGRMVIPVGEPQAGVQKLQLITRHGNTFHWIALDTVVFVALMKGIIK
ncbi:MAG: protein-L-isoaspartate(D-aspartate) O-methyltransferase [Coxiellaceae bacterium]|nr:MAG: protein-L-isoaspartate(D-aspartate) O-methyltransferase [Coxiellaceae bacterium]